MAESSFFGSVSPAQALNYTVTVPVSGGSGLSGNTIGGVGLGFRFSTNAYTNTYSVTCTVNYDGGSKFCYKSRHKNGRHQLHGRAVLVPIAKRF